MRLATALLGNLSDSLMKTINLLLAGTERRTNNLIQSVVLDACYNHAAVNCLQTGRVDELLSRGSRAGLDLIIATPNHLLPEPSRRSGTVSAAEVAGVIRTLKQLQAVPVVAVAVPAHDEWAFANAGADSILCLPFNGDALRAEVRRLLRMPQPAGEPESSRGSTFTVLLRGLRLLKNA